MFIATLQRHRNMRVIPSLDRERITAALGQHVAELFLKFCEPLPSEALRNMALDVDRYLVVLRKMLEVNRQIDIDLANRIASACMELLKQCDPAKPEQTALVVGAVRYFVYPYDAQDDLQSTSGLADDAMVVNFVIEETGLSVPTVVKGRL